MENYKQTLRKRVIFAGIYFAVLLLLIAAAAIFKLNEPATFFTLGFGSGTLVLMIIYIVRSLSALNNEEKIKNLYIKENDERQKYINAKVGGTGLNISMLFLILVMLVSNYFNRTVFLTIMAVVLFIIAVKFVLILYYNNKV